MWQSRALTLMMARKGCGRERGREREVWKGDTGKQAHPQ